MLCRASEPAAIAALVEQVHSRFAPFDRHPTRYLDPEGAVRCLIHVRDFHETPMMSAPAAEVFAAVQEDIVSVVLALRDSPAFGVAGVHTEGAVVKDPDFLNRLAPDPTAVLRDEVRQIVEDELLPTKRPTTNKEVGRISERTGLPVLPAELPWTYRAAKDAAGNLLESPAQRKRLIERDREDALLEIVADSAQPIAVAVFGGGHDWSDNIVAWNRAHPREKFALVEITPMAYQWCVVDGKSPKLLRRLTASVLQTTAAGR